MREETDNEFRAFFIILRKEGLSADTSGNRHKAPCNRTQHCCVRLYVAESLTGFKICATTPNNTQHVTSKTMLRVVGRQCCVRLHGA